TDPSGPGALPAVTIACDDLDDEGAALGTDRTGGEPARVPLPGAPPGESVLAAIEHRSPHRAEAWARLVQVTRSSPHRRAPACRAFGACGGCVLQHLDYPEQLRWKTGRVRAIAAAHPALGDVPVADCVASP